MYIIRLFQLLYLNGEINLTEKPVNRLEVFLLKN